MVQCHLSAMIINYQKDLLKGKEHEKFHVFFLLNKHVNNIDKKENLIMA